MTWVSTIKNWIVTAITNERSAHKVALSVSWGVYIAISPFMGLHTGMVFFFSWLLSLNGAIVLFISKVVNNPLTVVPLYAMCHAFGCWLLSWLHINPLALNPAWMAGLNGWISAHIGLSGISLGALFLGANVMGIIAALISYPLMRRYMELYHERGQLPTVNLIKASKEKAQNFVANVKPRIMHATKPRAPRSA